MFFALPASWLTASFLFGIPYAGLGLTVTLGGYLFYADWRLRNSSLYYHTVDTIHLLSAPEDIREHVVQVKMLSGLDLTLPI
jgi:hypothetical protein